MSHTSFAGFLKTAAFLIVLLFAADYASFAATGEPTIRP